jgi:peptidoglycan/LPS O-acetylase OafA/YrhL
MVTHDVAPGMVVGGVPGWPIGTFQGLARKMEARTREYPWVDLIIQRGATIADGRFAKQLLEARLRHSGARTKSVTKESRAGQHRLAVLDGWRGISILLVLACHLLPLGPKTLQLNDTAGPLGMALFFTLSGFLITRFLLHRSNITDFLIRRFFRIVPLAWLAMLVALPMDGAPLSSYLPNFLFYANLPPQHLTDVGSHLWSLCVEVQFYVGIALLVKLLGRRGLYLIPILCFAVTTNRIMTCAPVDIVTWRRVDEILAGAMLALAFEGEWGAWPARVLGRLNAYVLALLLVLCSHPALEAMNYLRPYVAATLVGTTLFNPPAALARVLKSRSLAYIAAISFALYVLHHIFMYSWLGGGDKIVMYAKRPLLVAATLLLAHVSTFQFERRCINFGKRVSARLTARHGVGKAMP